MGGEKIKETLCGQVGEEITQRKKNREKGGWVAHERKQEHKVKDEKRHKEELTNGEEDKKWKREREPLFGLYHREFISARAHWCVLLI